jgi:hypothetical protein
VKGKKRSDAKNDLIQNMLVERQGEVCIQKLQVDPSSRHDGEMMKVAGSDLLVPQGLGDNLASEFKIPARPRQNSLKILQKPGGAGPLTRWD